MELMRVLDRDAVDLLEATKTEAMESVRRNAVRAAFAAIEGMISAMKGVILEPFPGRRHHYSDAEVAMLREESYALTDKGEAIAQVRFIRLEDNLRFVWKMFVREWSIDVDADFSGDGWRAFRDSIKVRNRITHPRRPIDLTITDAELAQVERGYRFVHSMTTRNILRALQAARTEEYQRLERGLHPRALEWLDSLEQRGASPVTRELTPHESRNLVELETQCHADLMGSLRSVELIVESNGAPHLSQKGADYRAWRAKRGVPNH
jgi:hypothetical protein